MSLSQRDQQVIWHPYTQMQLSGAAIGIVRGEGIWLIDESGKKYMDAISSWWVNIHGHAHPYIARKVSEQLQNLEHVIFAGFTHEPAVALAERLLKILPNNQSKIFYSDNGSTATEVAVKMALQYWGNKGNKKLKVLALEHAYHGDTFGSMSISARSSFTQPFSDLLFDVIHVPFPGHDQASRSIENFKENVLRFKNEIAAFIFEPLVLGAGGMLMYAPEVLDELIKIAKENSILTIADEVMTGFGRTGRYFASDFLLQKPDVLCLSKGITGGTMPLGVTSCTPEIFDAFLSDDRTKTFFHGHSFTANPVACAAALASLDLLQEEKCFQNIKRIEAQHHQFAESHQQNPFIKNIRCCGTILAMDIESRDQTSYFNPLRDRLQSFFLEKGILLRPLGNTLYVMPPYCIANTELSLVYEAIDGASTLV